MMKYKLLWLLFIFFILYITNNQQIVIMKIYTQRPIIVILSWAWVYFNSFYFLFIGFIFSRNYSYNFKNFTFHAIQNYRLLPWLYAFKFLEQLLIFIYHQHLPNINSLGHELKFSRATLLALENSAPDVLSFIAVLRSINSENFHFC